MSRDRRGHGLPSRPDGARPIVGAESEVGASFTLELQRHAKTPKLWRLRLRYIAADGTTSIKNTEWAEFPAFSPDLLLARGQLQRFVFGDLVGRRPEVQRVSTE